MSKIGLFFGSFNPVHVGHLVIANYMVEFTDLDKVWFVVSPHNPLKEKKSLLPVHHRIAMLKRATEYDNRFKVSDIETRLPLPSYTIDTIIHLKELNPQHEFVLIMGSDGLPTFHKWKNYTVLEELVWRYVYPRPGDEALRKNEYKQLKWITAPLMDISSSFIRTSIKENYDVRYFMPQSVWEYMEEMRFYR